MAQLVKNPPTMRVPSLGWEDPLEKEKTLKSPSDSKEIEPVNPKGNQS